MSQAKNQAIVNVQGRQLVGADNSLMGSSGSPIYMSLVNGGAAETVIAPGALTLSANTARIATSGAGADAFTLAAGLPVGIKKRIVLGTVTVANDTAVITPVGLLDGETITLSAALDSVELQSTLTGWFVCGYSGTMAVN